MNELALQSQEAGVPDFYKPSAIMDPARFQHLGAVARVMADSSFMPETLRGKTREETYANAFLVVNISDRWGIDPFLAAQSMSVVYGKIMVEGKLVAAVLDKMLHVQLDYDHIRDGKGVITGIRVTGPRRGSGKMVSIEGTIAGWATKGKDGNILRQWTLPQAETQLIYRGTREWVRVYEPGILLGVITDDEYEPAYNARDITPRAEQSARNSVLDQLRAAKSDGGTSTQQTTESRDPHGRGKAEDISISSAEGETDQASPSETKNPDAQQTSSPLSSGESSVSPSEDSQRAGDASPPASSAQQSGEPTEEHWAWLRNVAKYLWAATNFNGDPDVLKNQKRGWPSAYPRPDGLPKAMADKAESVFKYCMQVCEGALEPDDARKMIAGIIHVDEKVLGKAGAA